MQLLSFLSLLCKRTGSHTKQVFSRELGSHRKADLFVNIAVQIGFQLIMLLFQRDEDNPEQYLRSSAGAMGY